MDWVHPLLRGHGAACSVPAFSSDRCHNWALLINRIRWPEVEREHIIAIFFLYLLLSYSGNAIAGRKNPKFQRPDHSSPSPERVPLDPGQLKGLRKRQGICGFVQGDLWDQAWEDQFYFLPHSILNNSVSWLLLTAMEEANMAYSWAQKKKWICEHLARSTCRYQFLLFLPVCPSQSLLSFRCFGKTVQFPVPPWRYIIVKVQGHLLLSVRTS
jgi:hypothetical protein